MTFIGRVRLTAHELVRIQEITSLSLIDSPRTRQNTRDYVIEFD